MTLPARLLLGIKLHENVLEVMHFDVCFDKSWYRKLSFSYRNNDILAVRLPCNRNGACRMHIRENFK